MKKYFIQFIMTVLFGMFHNVSLAQQDKEAEIKNLENIEGEAWVKKDSVTLFKLFSPDLVVNSPLNKVANLAILKMLMRTGKVDISSSEKKIDKISFIRDMAIVMGSDIVTPQGAMDNAGKTVTRRYTDVWIKDTDGWRLTIRQATIISVL
ncbi:MAG TPA: nuclear transport factor 2 family protein [Puia sp.]|nr:nuclear transport factor 2 family protein [Puia sp.]